MKQFAYIVLILSFFLAHVAYAQSTITFDDQNYINAQNLDNFSIINNGRTFEFSSTSNNDGYEYRTSLNLNTTAYSAGAVMITGFDATLATFKTTDGSEFDLESFVFVSDFANFPNSDHNLTVTGYKNNSAVSGAVFSTNISAVNNPIDLSGDDDFNDIDEIRLTNNGTGSTQYLNGGGLDNIIWNGPAGTDVPAVSNNFEFSDAVDNGNNVTETVNGITMTVTGGTPDLFNSGGIYVNFSGNAVWTSTAVSSLTVSFSSAIDITSAAFVDASLGSHTFVITPTGGTNTAVNVAAASTTAGVANLNWNSVTSFTVTKQGGGNVTFSIDNIVIPEVASAPTSATISAKVFLEGAYSASSDNLNTVLGPNIPLSQPFIFNSISGGTASSIPVGAVDWVVIELRETSSGATVGSGSGFLMNTGQIKDVDGSSDMNISLTGNSGSEFYLIVYHRNHVPVISASAVDAGSGTLTYDFTTAAGQALGSSQALLETNVYGMITGDADGSWSVDGSDLTSWRTSNGAVFSYGTNGRSDLNLDGVINAVDRNDYQQPNSGKSNQVPSN